MAAPGDWATDSISMVLGVSWQSPSTSSCTQRSDMHHDQDENTSSPFLRVFNNTLLCTPRSIDKKQQHEYSILIHNVIKPCNPCAAYKWLSGYHTCWKSCIKHQVSTPANSSNTEVRAYSVCISRNFLRAGPQKIVQHPHYCTSSFYHSVSIALLDFRQ